MFSKKNYNKRICFVPSKGDYTEMWNICIAFDKEEKERRDLWDLEISLKGAEILFYFQWKISFDSHSHFLLENLSASYSRDL